MPGPGPGQYNTPSQKSTVAFTMGSRHNSEKTLTSCPSIGSGSDEFFKKNIGCSFAKSKRDYILTKYIDSPGPGTYTSDAEVAKFNKAHKGFGLSKRLNDRNREKEVVPGPGNYIIPSSIGKSNAGFSLKSKYEDLEFKRKIKIPGPGDYNTESVVCMHKRAPSCTMGKSGSKISLYYSTNPGPGAYEPKPEVIRKKPSRWKISNAGRNIIGSDKLYTPGPGSYDLT